MVTVGGFFPVVVGANVGGLVGSAFGIPGPGVVGGALAFLVACLGTWLVEAWLWRRTWGRAALLLLVAGHVATWSVMGWRATRVRGPEPVEPASAVAWEGPPRAFLAGFAEVGFGLAEGDTLAGYGGGARREAWPWPVPGPLLSASTALMAAPGSDGKPRVPMLEAGKPSPESLGARAVVMRPAEGAGPALAICRLDLVMCDRALRAAVLARLEGLGVVEDTLWLVATHTHSGFGGFSRTPLACVVATDHFREDAFERVVKAAAEAVRRAHAAAVPARIGFVRAVDRGPDGRPVLAQNRAQDATPDRVDPEVLGIRLDAADGSRRIALVLNYAVHPTRWKPKHDRFSADVAGALERDPAIADGAGVLFVNGAEGDVRPRGTALDPSGDEGLAAPAFATAVAEGLRPRATEDLLRVVAATARRDLGSPRHLVPLLGGHGGLRDAAEAPFGSGLAAFVGNALCLPVNALAWSAGATDVRLAASVDGSLGVLVGLSRYVETTRWPFGALRLETPSSVAAVVGVPGEATTAVGERLKEAARRAGASTAFVFGLANDHFAYCGTADECAQGTYEGRMTLYGAREADLVVEACEAALDATGAAR
jgi:hypothetical protein